MTDDRAVARVLARVTRNEELLRRANDAVAETGAQIAPRRTLLPFLCECTEIDCGELVDVALADYVEQSLYAHRFFVTHRCALLSVDREASVILRWRPDFAVVDRLHAAFPSQHHGMDARERRLAENEQLFRTLNEQVDEIKHRTGSVMLFVCECSDDGCRERLDLRLDEYERVRDAPGRFALRPGHDEPSIERVVEANDRFVVVEKSV